MIAAEPFPRKVFVVISATSETTARRRTRRPLAPAQAAERRADAGRSFRVALCVPLQGAAGIWGPSCLASAQLARLELNRQLGVAGRQCELLPIDASDESPDVEDSLIDLVDEGAIDAIVSMCISSVRERIVRAVGGRVPFVYTCLYEGGAMPGGVYAIGETAANQIRPSIAWLCAHHRPRRWMLIGNDYVWPRVSHGIARGCIAAAGGEVVGEQLVPFGLSDFSPLLDALRRSRADALLLSMVGQDAVEFNRAFARAGLSKSVLRLSCAIEENQLLAIGADSTENLYVALGYFGALDTNDNGAFKERYHQQFGERAPTLNSIGQSTYEGLHFLAALLSRREGGSDRGPRLAYRSARRGASCTEGGNGSPIYLARAEGHSFRVLARF